MSALSKLLKRAADAIEDGSEWEGLCADCGIDRFNHDGAKGEHHSEECIVRELRRYAGEDDDMDVATPSSSMGGTKPSDPDDGVDDE